MEIASDGGREFIATETQDFLRAWGVNHRVSSAYFAQSNGRAEAAVKSVKRLLQTATSPCGSLDTDAFMTAMLAHRNTPDQESGLSPAQVIYRRNEIQSDGRPFLRQGHPSAVARGLAPQGTCPPLTVLQKHGTEEGTRAPAPAARHGPASLPPEPARD